MMKNKQVVLMYHSIGDGALQEAGYTVAFTSNPRDNDGFRFGRVSVKGSWSVEYFRKVLQGKVSLKERSQELVKSSAKRVLGARGYDLLRERLLRKGV